MNIDMSLTVHAALQREFSQENSMDTAAMACMSPTVELGRDFERLILRCIQEKQRLSMHPAVQEDPEIRPGAEVSLSPKEEENDVETSSILAEVSAGEIAHQHNVADLQEVHIARSAPVIAQDTVSNFPTATQSEGLSLPNPDMGTANTCYKSGGEPNEGEARGNSEHTEVKVETENGYENDFPVLAKPCTELKRLNIDEPRSSKKSKGKKPSRCKWIMASIDIVGFDLQKRSPAPCEATEEMDWELECFENELVDPAVESSQEVSQDISEVKDSESKGETSALNVPSTEKSAQEEDSKCTNTENKDSAEMFVANTGYHSNLTNNTKPSTGRKSRKNRHVSFGPRSSTSYYSTCSTLKSSSCCGEDYYNHDVYSCGYLSDNVLCDLCQDELPNLMDSWEIYTGKIHWKQLEFIEQFSGLRARKYLRTKHKWQEERAHKQIKTKRCRSVHNRPHGLALFIHHRVAKHMAMALGPVMQRSTISLKRIDNEKGFVGKYNKGSSTTTTVTNPKARLSHRRPVRPQPAHTLTAYNADTDLSADLVNLLLTLQDRDITPEDYDLLLRLDERVEAKTVDDGVLDKLRTETITAEQVASGEVECCAICMEDYVAGDSCKHLPCGHFFHATCIENWLSNSSPNCPLDGQEVS